MVKVIIVREDDTVIETITVQDDPMNFERGVRGWIEDTYDQEFISYT